jgi:integrase-like protein
MNRKRGNGEGTIHRRKNGGWCAQYTVYTAKGRKRRTLYCKTRQEVAAKLAKALSDREGGFAFDVVDLKIEEYLERWLNDSVRNSVKQRTFENYAYVVRSHLIPALGHIKADSHSCPRASAVPLQARRRALAAHSATHTHYPAQGVDAGGEMGSGTPQRDGGRRGSKAGKECQEGNAPANARAGT